MQNSGLRKILNICIHISDGSIVPDESIYLSNCDKKSECANAVANTTSDAGSDANSNAISDARCKLRCHSLIKHQLLCISKLHILHCRHHHLNHRHSMWWHCRGVSQYSKDRHILLLHKFKCKVPLNLKRFMFKYLRVHKLE